jgi:hypothetical protein
MGGVQPISEDQESDDGTNPEKDGSSISNRPNRKWIDVAVDSGALTLAVIIDLILNAIVFWTISPDWITGIGMVCLSFIVVMFSLRGWVKGGWQGRTLWAVFAVVATFSDISFALSVTDLQSRSSGVDTEMVRLTDKVDHDQVTLDKLLEGYTEVGTGYRTELTVRQSAIEDARKALQASEQSRKEYVKKEPAMDSKAVFEAIPDAVTDGRWIQLTFFFLMFIGLQLTIISAASKVSVDSNSH